jgi:hypothetical protein
MKTSYTAGALFAVWLAAPPGMAQELIIPDVAYPRLPQSGASLNAFVPQGWKIELKSAGDLNGDGTVDGAMLLRMTDAKNILANTDGMGENPFDTNPRILAVAFANAGGGYILAVQNHTLIPRRADPVVEDPITDSDSLVIVRGTLKVRLGFFTSAGGWTTFNSTYRFRYQNNRFELIGFDKITTERNSGEIHEVSVNYSTGKVEIATGNIENDDKKITTKKLRKGKSPTIDSIGDGLEFDPMPAL